MNVLAKNKATKFKISFYRCKHRLDTAEEIIGKLGDRRKENQNEALSGKKKDEKCGKESKKHIWKNFQKFQKEVREKLVKAIF